MVAVPCILKTSFLATELGGMNPYAVSDALDNSGLAFGPRQIDIGQGSAAAKRAEQFLLAGETPQEQNMYRKFFAPIERLTPSGYEQLYAEIIPAFNAKLSAGPVKEFVLEDFLTTIEAPVPEPALIEAVGLPDVNERHAFQAVVIDFNNKWAGTTKKVAAAMPKRSYASACEATVEWEKSFELQHPPAGDIKDAHRRADIVLHSYYWEVYKPPNTCTALKL